MAEELPPELARLFASSTPDERDLAWRSFLDAYSRLILRVAHSLGGGHDAAMDRYTYALDGLQQNDHARLRSYVPDGRCRFSTWLVIVVRRLCLDHHRRRYGERRGRDEEAEQRRATRRRLEDLVGERLDVAELPGSASDSPDAGVRESELREALVTALDGLDARDRLLLKLRFEFDAPVVEIAQIMGFPSPFHVYRRINGVLSRLKSSLVDRGVEDPVP